MRRLTSSIYGLWAAGMVADGLRLRGRLARLAVLDDFLAGTGPGRPPLHAVDPATPTPGRGSDAGRDLEGLDDGFRLLRAPDVAVDQVTLRAALRFARFHDLAVVDLIPGDLPVAPLLELIRRVNPATYRTDRLVPGRGASHATLVRAEVVERAGIDPAVELDPVAYVEAMRELKRHAPDGTDLVIAPRLRAVETDVAWHVPTLRAVYGGAAPVLAGAPVVGAALLAAGPRVGRIGGALAVAAAVTQPYVATTGLALCPRDLKVLPSLTRNVRDAVRTVRSLRATPPPAVQARARDEEAADAARRRRYADPDLDGFFEPPRVTCPWCADDAVHDLVTVPDLLQGKPGRFRLDECDGCGHVFQNPRLTPEGLDYYYGDFYDGLGDEGADFIFSLTNQSYVGRASMLDGVATPKRWLDVGTGHGHFCLVAKEHWPETRFDGLDFGEAIAVAERRGWIERGHRGLFPELAEDLVGSYDVVSMHHYLEHTREPDAELDAAHTVLERGGHLLVEVPDPESRLGRKLGWMWGPWFQPQHQQFLSVGNLTGALEDRGFDVVSVERGPAHQPVDLGFAMWLLVNRLAPHGDVPWQPKPGRAQRALRAATFAAFTPVMAGALATDHVLAPLMRQIPGASNTYRLLARKG
jgi:SAM-dependent methyltransferase